VGRAGGLVAPMDRLHREIKAAEAIKAGILSLTDDTDAIRDTLEGETNLQPMIRAMLLSIEDDQAMVDGAKARIDDLRGRKDRFEDRIKAKRALVEQAMAVAEIDKVETDLATVSLRNVPPDLIVTAEADVPSRFFVPQPPKRDDAAIKAALKAGETIPGATLSNGGRAITIRRK
jgi:hypothetical protein